MNIDANALSLLKEDRAIIATYFGQEFLISSLNTNFLKDLNSTEFWGADSKEYYLLLHADSQLLNLTDHIPEVLWELIDYNTKPTYYRIEKGSRNKTLSFDDNSLFSFMFTLDETLTRTLQKIRQPLILIAKKAVSSKYFAATEPADSQFIVDLPAELKNTIPSIIQLGTQSEVSIIRK